MTDTITRGHNQPPDWATDVTNRMASDYAELSDKVASQLNEARQLPATVDDEDQLRVLSDHVVAMRDTAVRSEAYRKNEKEPYLRAGQAVDGFFSSLSERLNAGIKVLSKRANDYQQKKLHEERERRRLEAEATARAEAAKREAALKAAQAAEEARLAAERARKLENIEAKSAIATQAEIAASQAASEAALAADQAEAAHIDTLRKPSDMARSRFDQGRLVTMKAVGYVEITDKMALDPALLWPFIKEEHALQALKAWAKTTAHKRQMNGAIVEMREDTVIR